MKKKADGVEWVSGAIRRSQCNFKECVHNGKDRQPHTQQVGECHVGAGSKQSRVNVHEQRKGFIQLRAV